MSTRNLISAAFVTLSCLVASACSGGGNTPPCSDCTSEGWQPLATQDSPTARILQSTVWTGDRMIVWGGKDKVVEDTDTGAIYDPTTDSWVTMSTVNAPSPREGHSASWTGDRMIVWGGVEHYTFTFYRDGAIYDPATDSWKAISTENAPDASIGHSAVWTGDHLVIWGGADRQAFTDIGAIYDPATDSWHAMSAVGAPSARYMHTAVWTGSKMLVWGGFADGNCFNDGAIYDPATDSWHAMNATGSPSARYMHTAVWDGSEMIVWGGFNENSAQPLSDGAIYDPTTDSWHAMSATGSPSARYMHTAVWDGSEMIVWGGSGDANHFVLDDGAIYDPSADSWTPVTPDDRPAGRAFHSAVWTGSKMLVWGGINQPSLYLNDGASYTP